MNDDDREWTPQEALAVYSNTVLPKTWTIYEDALKLTDNKKNLFLMMVNLTVQTLKDMYGTSLEAGYTWQGWEMMDWLMRSMEIIQTVEKAGPPLSKRKLNEVLLTGVPYWQKILFGIANIQISMQIIVGMRGQANRLGIYITPFRWRPYIWRTEMDDGTPCAGFNLGPISIYTSEA
jgi:hypothetical protein